MIKIYDNIEINSDYDYYEWLRVDKNATTEEIIKAGDNRRAELLSESVNMSGEDVATSYTLLNLAVKILSDNELRNAYDSLVKEVNNEVNKAFSEDLINLAEKQLEDENKNQRIAELENEADALRKLNEDKEEYIKELERKLSISDAVETADINKEDEANTNDFVEEEPKVEEKPISVIKIESNNDNTKNNGKDNDIKPIFKDTEEEPQKVVEVEEVDKKERFAAKLSSLGSKAFLTVAGISALAIAILAYSSNSSKRAESILEENGIDTNMVNSIDDDTEVEEEITEQVSTIEEEPYEVELDVNSDTVIYETVDKIESEISKISDPVVKDMFNRETIEALVRYTRDNTILSGETAYELFQVLYNNGIDTSMFFENLDSYQVMNTLFLSTKAIDQNNNSYDDENNAYNAINSAVDYLSPDDFAAIWNVSAITDQVTGYSSMLIASGCAEENGLEGSEYQNELNSVPAEVRENAKNVYNKVKPYDNSYIMELRINALDNENVRTLG